MRILLTNCPKDAAGRIAQDLVERRIAACVNALDVDSVYRWEGTIVSEPETALMIKVAEEAVAAAKARILETHPYALPEILVLPVDAEASLAPYVGWVRGEARGGERPDRARLFDARSRGMAFLIKQLRPDGSFGPGASELAAYYRVPAAMAAAGWSDSAHQVLDHIARTFISTAGCVRVGDEDADEQGELWVLANAWVALGAQRLARYELAGPLVRCLLRASHEESGGFLARHEGADDPIVDLRVTTHIATLLLAVGRVERAAAAGRWIRELVELQPSSDTALYLRRDPGGALVTDFDPATSFVHVVQAAHVRQAWFVLGHAVGFLTLLARATGDPGHRATARRIMDFLHGANPRMMRDHHAHKVAWGAALYARDSGDPAALAMAGRISSWLVEAQGDDGGFLPDARLQDRLALTAEISLWLGEVASSLAE